MQKHLLLILFLMIIGQLTPAQTLDTVVYNRLVKANKDEFITYAKSVGLETAFDTASQTLFAKKKGCLYAKPLAQKGGNTDYELVMIVSTLNKENNKLIFKKAAENPAKKGTWVDSKYIYIEWDLENPISKEMWYKVLVYKKKQ